MVATGAILTDAEWTALVHQVREEAKASHAIKVQQRADLEASKPLPLHWNKHKGKEIRRKRRALQGPNEIAQATFVLRRIIDERNEPVAFAPQ